MGRSPYPEDNPLPQVNDSDPKLVQGEHSQAWPSVTFGFEFDPSQLARALNVDWVRENS
jgi:hypothetical protein